MAPEYCEADYHEHSFQVRSVSKSSDLEELENCKIAVQSFRELENSGDGEIVAYYKSDVVMVHYSSKRDVNLNRKDLIELVKVSKYGNEQNDWNPF